jgi:Flp pilus assembly protein TadD
MKPAICLLLALALAPAWAVDTEEPAPPRSLAAKDRLAAARSHVGAKRWAEALTELKRVNDRGSADWNNLLGYVLRKQPAPDLAGAERAYDEALRIAPEHRGALEYSGELYLMKGDLAKAEQRAATLARVCASACEEYADLKKAVDRYKAAGNKFVAAP